MIALNLLTNAPNPLDGTLIKVDTGPSWFDMVTTKLVEVSAVVVCSMLVTAVFYKLFIG